MSKNYIENLFLTGCVVKTRITIWSGRKKLKPGDLGIPEKEINKDLVTLGSKWIIPKEEIDKLYRLRAKALASIDSDSFDFDFGRFVSNKRLDHLKNSLNEIKSEFDSVVSDIGQRYDEITQKMITSWETEAVAIASRRNDPDLVFEVMNRIRAAFKPWSEVKNRFIFEYSEHRDINKIAEEFVKSSTMGIVERFSEFAQKLKVRIEDSNLSERNLKPIRKYLESLRESLFVFDNKELNTMIETMESWTMDGVSEDLSTSKKLSMAMSKAMDGIIDIAENQMDEIAMKSVEAITSYSHRKIKV